MNDRFDARAHLDRVGVHRAPETRWWRWWMTAVVAVASCVLLTTAGLFALSTLRTGEPPTLPDFAGPVAVTDPSTLDPAVTITVLDAAGDGEAAGAGERAGATLTEAGWPVAAVGPANEERATTVVYFEGEALEGAALGVVEVLGVGSVAPSDGAGSGSPITVVVGADMTGAPAP